MFAAWTMLQSPRRGAGPRRTAQQRTPPPTRATERSARLARTVRDDSGHLMLGERIASQSEVIRAIVSDYSPCCGGSRTAGPPVSPESLDRHLARPHSRFAHCKGSLKEQRGEINSSTAEPSGHAYG